MNEEGGGCLSGLIRTLLYILLFLGVLMECMRDPDTWRKDPTPTPVFAPTRSEVWTPTLVERTPTLVATATPGEDLPTSTRTPQPAVGYVNVDLMNVRSGPGAEYQVITQIAKGTLVVIIGTNLDRTWWEARLPDGTVGWVFGEYIDESGCVECVPVSRIPPTPTKSP